MAKDLAAVVKQIKAEVEHLRPRDTVFRPIPFGGGALIGQFHMVDPDRFGEILDEEDTDTRCALMIFESCKQICHLNGTGKPEPIPHGDGRPVRFDLEFAEQFGLELGEQTGVDVVKACWTLEDGTLSFLALRRFSDDLIMWMQNTQNPILDELVGESRGDRP